MPKGNPNPSPATRFKPGESGNPGGKSAEQIANEREAARISAEMRVAILSSMQEKVNAGEDPLELLSSDIRALFKDSEDRAHGQATQTIDATIDHKAEAEAKVDAILDGIIERSGETGEAGPE